MPRLEPAVGERLHTAEHYRAMTEKLELQTRVEALSVRRVPIVKHTAKGKGLLALDRFMA